MLGYTRRVWLVARATAAVFAAGEWARPRKADAHCAVDPLVDDFEVDAPEVEAEQVRFESVPATPLKPIELKPDTSSNASHTIKTVTVTVGNHSNTTTLVTVGEPIPNPVQVVPAEHTKTVIVTEVKSTSVEEKYQKIHKPVKPLKAAPEYVQTALKDLASELPVVKEVRGHLGRPALASLLTRWVCTGHGAAERASPNPQDREPRSRQRPCQLQRRQGSAVREPCQRGLGRPACRGARWPARRRPDHQAHEIPLFQNAKLGPEQDKQAQMRSNLDGLLKNASKVAGRGTACGAPAMVRSRSPLATQASTSSVPPAMSA